MLGEQPWEQVVSRLLPVDTLGILGMSRATGQDDRLDEGAVTAASDFLASLDEAIRMLGVSDQSSRRPRAPTGRRSCWPSSAVDDPPEHMGDRRRQAAQGASAMLDKGDLVNDHGISDPNWVRLKLPSGATGYVAALYLKATTRATSPTAADTYQTASH
jgi:hypothetical protein